MAEPVGAGGIEVDMDLVGPPLTNTSRGLDTPSYEVRARHNMAHISTMTWCEVCVSSRRDAVHRSSSTKRDASIPIIEFDYGESGRGAIPTTTSRWLLLLTRPMRCSMLLEHRTRVPMRSMQLQRCRVSFKTWVTLQLSCGPTLSLRLWQCWKLSVTGCEFLDKARGLLNEAFRRFVHGCGHFMLQLNFLLAVRSFPGHRGMQPGCTTVSTGGQGHDRIRTRRVFWC